MQEFLAGQGRTAVSWDEAGESGDLSADLVLTAWRDPVYGVRAIDRGHRVIMAPHGSTSKLRFDSAQVVANVAAYQHAGTASPTPFPRRRAAA